MEQTKTMDFTQQQTTSDAELFDFLNNAPKFFREGERIKKFQLKNGDYIHCVLWNYHFYITGTDIVKILVWRFQNANRQLGNMKKFEEGIFSDLRNLKPGVDASLENPRSDFLEFLYKNGCIRTQKKQKVFYWYSVPHEPLFCDALERDMRRDNSHYNYNGYSHENRQRFNDTTSNIKFQSYPAIQTSQFYSPVKFESNKLDIKKAEDKKDLFNIKTSLFNEYGCANINMPYKEIDSSKSDFSFEKLLSTPQSSRTVTPVVDSFEDESKLKQIKNSIGSTLKRRFDDFDLDQFGFLKDSCEWKFREASKNCELKSLENDKKPDQIQNESAKIQFVNPDRIEQQ